MLVTGGPPTFGGGGIPQRIMSQSAFGSGVAHDGSGIIGEHTGHRWQVADVAVDDPE
jgi:hypothetical protein